MIVGAPVLEQLRHQRASSFSCVSDWTLRPSSRPATPVFECSFPSATENKVGLMTSAGAFAATSLSPPACWYRPEKRACFAAGCSSTVALQFVGNRVAGHT